MFRFKTKIIVFFFCLFSQPLTFAGECKVKYPAPSVRANSIAFSAHYLAYRDGIFAARFREKTGANLELMLVARAGQSPDKTFIINQWIGDQAVSIPSLIEAASNKVMTDDPSRIHHYLIDKKTHPDDEGRMIYSHVGLTYNDQDRCWEHPNPDTQKHLKTIGWCFQHELRPCVDEDAPDEFDNYNKPYSWNQSTAQFFADDPYELRAQVAIPKLWLQKRIKEIAKSVPRYEALTGSIYNVLAKWDHSSISKRWQNNLIEKMKNKTDEQNSNQWVLEIVAAAAAPPGTVKNRYDVVEFLKKTNYLPSIMILDSNGYRMFADSGENDLGRWVVPMMRIDSKEQPYIKQYSLAEIVTVKSIIEWMARNNWLETLTYHNKPSTSFEILMAPRTDYREKPEFEKLDKKFNDILAECRKQGKSQLNAATNEQRRQFLANCLVKEYGYNVEAKKLLCSNVKAENIQLNLECK